MTPFDPTIPPRTAAGPDTRSAGGTPPAGPRVRPPGDVLACLGPAGGPGELGRIARYAVVGVLGKGGMGVVFEARKAGLDRTVAIKVMRPEVAAQPTERKRFLREAASLAAVPHPNVIEIYDIDEDRGLPFIVMPRLTGETLGDRLAGAKGRLSVREILALGAGVAAGLAAVHKRELVHRDIKPSNVWLRAESGGAVILDFGLARPQSADELMRVTELTVAGTVLGTPDYMAPEQARAGAIDHRADLFSLGCLLYHAATGRKPFTGMTAMQVLWSVASDTPVPPHTLRPDLPPGLAALINGLMAKDRNDRAPGTAAGVAARVEEIMRASGHFPPRKPKPPEPPPPDPGPPTAGGPGWAPGGFVIEFTLAAAAVAACGLVGWLVFTLF